jgi:hypothetical protein
LFILAKQYIAPIMKKLYGKLIHFWDEDKSLATMMFLLFAFIFVLIPLLKPDRFGQVIIKLVYSVMLFTAILSVSKNRKYVVIIGIFAFVALVINWLSDIKPTLPLLVAQDFSAILFNSLFALAILVKTFKPGDITYQRIEGSIVVYLLLGMIFAYIYHAVYLIAGDSSFNNINTGNGLREFLYFSFTSLTTMGYGDITPVHPMARSVANFEALIGQLYPAILIARLVTMEFESSAKKRQGK